MPYRRSPSPRHRRKPPRVKTVRYVVPTTRRAPDHLMPLTVPTRWVINIIAIFLLPWCAILTQTFFSALQRARDSGLWDRELIRERRAIRPAPLRRSRYYLGVPSYLHLLDDPEKPDGSERSRNVFFARFHLSDESCAFERPACDCIAANHFC